VFAWPKISIKPRCNSLVLLQLVFCILCFVPVVENSTSTRPTYTQWVFSTGSDSNWHSGTEPTHRALLRLSSHPVTLPRVNLSSIRIRRWARAKTEEWEGCLLVLCRVLAMISITKWKTIVPIRSRQPGKKALTNQVRISPQNKNISNSHGMQRWNCCN